MFKLFSLLTWEKIKPWTRHRRVLWSGAKKYKNLMLFIILPCCFWADPGCHSCQDWLTPVWCVGLVWDLCVSVRHLRGCLFPGRFWARRLSGAPGHDQALCSSRHTWQPFFSLVLGVNMLCSPVGKGFSKWRLTFFIQLLLNCTSEGRSILSVLIFTVWFSGKFSENL